MAEPLCCGRRRPAMPPLRCHAAAARGGPGAYSSFGPWVVPNHWTSYVVKLLPHVRKEQEVRASNNRPGRFGGRSLTAPNRVLGPTGPRRAKRQLGLRGGLRVRRAFRLSQPHSYGNRFPMYRPWCFLRSANTALDRRRREAFV